MPAILGEKDGASRTRILWKSEYGGKFISYLEPIDYSPKFRILTSLDCFCSVTLRMSVVRINKYESLTSGLNTNI